MLRTFLKEIDFSQIHYLFLLPKRNRPDLSGRLHYLRIIETIID